MVLPLVPSLDWIVTLCAVGSGEALLVDELLRLDEELLLLVALVADDVIVEDEELTKEDVPMLLEEELPAVAVDELEKLLLLDEALEDKSLLVELIEDELELVDVTGMVLLDTATEDDVPSIE